MKLSIVIVSWNVKDRLKVNLKALFSSQTSFDFEVFVVDNASGDDSVLMLKKEFPQVKVIANQNNLGFSRANNQAITLAQGDFILLLNPDMELERDTLQKSLSWAEDNTQAIVSGCRLFNDSGETIRQVRRFPQVIDQLLIILKLPHIYSKIISRYLNYDFDYQKAARVDSIRGSFFLINRRSFRKLSGREPLLDERYFVWFEEVDFCQQVYKQGGEVWYTPAAECLDHIGQSFNQLKRKQAQKYFKESMLKYFEKWEVPWKAKLLKLAWSLMGIFI